MDVDISMAASRLFHILNLAEGGDGQSNNPGDAAADDSSAHSFDWPVFVIPFMIISFMGMFFVGVIYYTERVCGGPQFERTDGCRKIAWKALKFALLIRLVEKCWGCCRSGRAEESTLSPLEIPRGGWVGGAAVGGGGGRDRWYDSPPYIFPSGSYAPPPWGDSLGYGGRDIPLGNIGAPARRSNTSGAWSGSTLAPHSGAPERPAAARVPGAGWETSTLRGG